MVDQPELHGIKTLPSEAAKPAAPERLPAIASPPPETGSVALMALIERAVSDDRFDPDKLDKLLAVKERWEANEARKAFVVAKAGFKSEAPEIDKNKHVGFDSSKGGARTDYWHATLDHVEALLSPALSKHGLTYSWETEQPDSGQIKVTCVLTHILGHSERVSLQAAPDTSGNKNSIQAVGSTVTFLSRYTLLAVTGMATGDMDDDGRGAGSAITLVDEKQVKALRETLELVGADEAKFLAYFAIPELEMLPVAKFGQAMNALNAKRKKDAPNP